MISLIEFFRFWFSGLVNVPKQKEGRWKNHYRKKSSKMTPIFEEISSKSSKSNSFEACTAIFRLFFVKKLFPKGLCLSQRVQNIPLGGSFWTVKIEKNRPKPIVQGWDFSVLEVCLNERFCSIYWWILEGFFWFLLWVFLFGFF